MCCYYIHNTTEIQVVTLFHIYIQIDFDWLSIFFKSSAEKIAPKETAIILLMFFYFILGLNSHESKITAYITFNSSAALEIEVHCIVGCNIHCRVVCCLLSRMQPVIRRIEKIRIHPKHCCNIRSTILAQPQTVCMLVSRCGNDAERGKRMGACEWVGVTL